MAFWQNVCKRADDTSIFYSKTVQLAIGVIAIGAFFNTMKDTSLKNKETELGMLAAVVVFGLFAFIGHNLKQKDKKKLEMKLISDFIEQFTIAKSEYEALTGNDALSQEDLDTLNDLAKVLPIIVNNHNVRKMPNDQLDLIVKLINDHNDFLKNKFSGGGEQYDYVVFNDVKDSLLKVTHRCYVIYQGILKRAANHWVPCALENAETKVAFYQEKLPQAKSDLPTAALLGDQNV